MSLSDFKNALKGYTLTPSQLKEAAEIYARSGIAKVLEYLDGMVRKGKPGKAERKPKEWLPTTGFDVAFALALLDCKFGMNRSAERFAESIKHNVIEEMKITHAQRKALALAIHRYRKQTGERLDQLAMEWLRENGVELPGKCRH
jgi:hypothetical protein